MVKTTMGKRFSTSYVLDKTGVSKELLFYLERQGLIASEREVVGKIDRRWWNNEEIEKIRLIFKYTNDGLTPKESARRALQDMEQGINYAVSGNKIIKKRLEKLKSVLESNPDMLISVQGTLELKDINFIDSILMAVQNAIDEKNAINKSKIIRSMDSSKYLFRNVDLTKIYFFNRKAVEKICKRLGIKLKGMIFPDNLFGLSVAINSSSEDCKYIIFINQNIRRQRALIISHELLHILSGDLDKHNEFFLKLINANISSLNEGKINA